MGKITVTNCEIDGLYVIEPTVFPDARGYFVETYNQRDFEEAGLNMKFVQDNQSMSKTYGKWFGVVLSAENKKQFYISEGFAHGFLVLSDEAEFAYKCTDFYHPGDEGGIIWNDPSIGIEWPIAEGMEINLSEKDTKWNDLAHTFHFS